jgi:hypothetical protein
VQVTKELIESLLRESESTTLDFKSQQYPFATATDDQKSEIVKDVLAFANAFARADAFILIGIKDGKGTRGEVVGVSEQLEDAHLQQLVNGCIKRNLVLSYVAMEIDGKPIGVIHIPRQKRPFYSVKDFGKIKKNEVYFRRGSSTAVASPDDIAAMGVDQVASAVTEPVLEFSLFDKETGTLRGPDAAINAVFLEVPPREEIPDYDEGRSGLHFNMRRVNHDYNHELVEYTFLTQLMRRVSFAVTNKGDVTANGVRIRVEVNKPDWPLIFMHEDNIPEPPETSTFESNFAANIARIRNDLSPLTVRQVAKKWEIECDFGKVQAKATEVLRDDLFVGSANSGSLALRMKIYADNLAAPTNAECMLNFETGRKAVDLEGIEAIEAERLRNTPEGRRALTEKDD